MTRAPDVHHRPPADEPLDAFEELDDPSPHDEPPGSMRPDGRPLRVVLFTDTLADVNGVSRFILDAARHARLLGRDFRVVTSTSLPCPEAENIINLKPLASGPMPGYTHLEVASPPFLRAARLLAELQPDIVHVSTPGPVGFSGRWAARRAGIPLMGVYHTDFPSYFLHLFDDDAMAWITSEILRRFYAPFAKIFTRSRDYAKALQKLGVHCRRITRLRPGTDTKVFHPRYRDPSIWARLIPADGHAGGGGGDGGPEFRVLSSGRVSVEKNLPLLASVWRQVDSRCRALGAKPRLVVLGDGPYRAEMERTLAGHSATFLGFRHGEELSRIYASSDLLAFPSMTDTLGQVVMESQASGVPVLVSDVGGPREMTADGRTGLVLPGRDEDAWVEAMVSLITDPARAAAMGKAARIHIEPHSIVDSFEHFWSVHERVWRSVDIATRPG